MAISKKTCRAVRYCVRAGMEQSQGPGSWWAWGVCKAKLQSDNTNENSTRALVLGNASAQAGPHTSAHLSRPTPPQRQSWAVCRAPHSAITLFVSRVGQQPDNRRRQIRDLGTWGVNGSLGLWGLCIICAIPLTPCALAYCSFNTSQPNCPPSKSRSGLGKTRLTHTQNSIN